MVAHAALPMPRVKVRSIKLRKLRKFKYILEAQPFAWRVEEIGENPGSFQ